MYHSETWSPEACMQSCRPLSAVFNYENLYSPETGSERKNKIKKNNLTTKRSSCPHIHHNHIPHSPRIPKCRTILSQCLNLHKNFSLLFSIISMGNGKLKYSLQSFITSIFDDLNNFIKNRVTRKSSEQRSALSKE